eukprot:SAG11_NODE_22187_length_410_cov_1.607717_1_plen_27_part_01
MAINPNIVTRNFIKIFVDGISVWLWA